MEVTFIRWERREIREPVGFICDFNEKELDLVLTALDAYGHEDYDELCETINVSKQKLLNLTG